MKFKRHISKQLHEWKAKSKRKPLILRGARQVGKTTLIHEFAKTYKFSISLNLERPEHLKYFQDFDDAKTIVDALFLTNNLLSSQKQDTLLFIDEIQASSAAISLLRYFYEDVPELNVIAAGSLLEHVMKDVRSFPVGRVEYLYLHPLNFTEFLEATGHESALAQLTNTPVAKFAHPVLRKLFHEYAIIGGMPEVVSTYLENKSLADLPATYESIWQTYKEDVEKYARNDSQVNVIRHIMKTAHTYIDQRIKFQNFGNSNYKSKEIGESLRKLNDARVIQLIYPTTEITPPIRPDIKKSPRLQFLDTGLVNYELNIQANMLTLDDFNNAFKGAIIPHLITQEIISLNSVNAHRPHFWVREKKQAAAEVDLVYEFNGLIIPIEIKSGKQGKLRSLHQFVERTNHSFAIRMYAGEFSVEQHKTPMAKKPYWLMNLPYYLGTQIPEYVEYFVANYALND